MDERACGQWPENHAKGIFFPCKVIKKGIGCWQGKSTRPASHRRGLASNPKAIPARILSNPSSGSPLRSLVKSRIPPISGPSSSKPAPSSF
ncbi:uncharacterized protein LOC117654186 isoform X2 [Thrips palmi]|uniref:Uncharacterized protein LOC117654186 isoform X2 n=1 Tax=Thrips palmi TaxID=161013 RepID=A0A6P9ADJ0_THRPL|nr:uncharacterized protein LOC117654186 isoform X2 [Thrips palmi]